MVSAETAAAKSPPRAGGRTAIVGTGSRGQMYLRGVVDRINVPGNSIVAFCDKNIGRVAYYNRLLQELGQPKAAEYTEDRFEEMLEKEKVEVLVITTMDSTHHMYIIPALKRGIRVITEKPMTTEIENCKEILRAVRDSGNHLTLAFNYRYNPVHEKVKTLIASKTIGRVISVHFEWLLNTVHGADYFRRWHRQKQFSGGLMIHKSGHHFDLVNWWLASRPKEVFGMGKTAFYGDKAGGVEAGWAKKYERSLGSTEAANDPFALHMEKDEHLKELYVENEKHDGYIRDMNVFHPSVEAEDDMSVLVRFENEAMMTYHLTAYSPWEGYRVMFNGTKGRIELEVVESTHNELAEPAQVGPGSIHGTKAMKHAGGSRISVHPLWQKPYEVEVKTSHEGHGGGDKRLLNTLFGPADGSVAETDTASQMASTEVDGANALAIGLAANESFVTGKLINVDEMLRI